MKSKHLLFFLVPTLIGSLIYGYLQMPHQDRVTAGKELSSQVKKNQQKQKNTNDSSATSPRLRIDLLEWQSHPYPGVNRDLFFAGFESGQYEKSIATDLTEAPPEEIVQPIVVPVAPPPPPPPSAQEVANQELSPYKFVGFFKKGEMQTIFLSSAGEIYLVRKGDYLGRDHKYYVLNITDTTLMLRKEGVGDFSIKLTDQGTLAAVSLQGQLRTESKSVPLPRIVPVAPIETLAPQTQEVEIIQPDQQEAIPVFEDEPQTEDQQQPEEDSNETQD